VPVLVLSGDLDTNTPPLARRQVARRFRHATWALIANAGHTPTAGSACAGRLAMRFVQTLAATSGRLQRDSATDVGRRRALVGLVAVAPVGLA